MTGCRMNYQPYPIYTTVLTGKNLPPHLGYRKKIPDSLLDLLANQPKPETPPGTMKQKLIQTMFRESEAQTDPYSPEVAEGTSRGLEILTLGWLSYNNGLPAGMNEILTIERARQRRAWEAALPLPFDETTKDLRAKIIQAMEINEWNYREETMAAMVSLRMELAEKLAKERSCEAKLKYEQRLSKYIQIKKEEKNKKLLKLRLNFNRNIRKLLFARQKINRRYHRWNIIKQFTDKTSEWYAPQMRFGEDPRHWHEKIDPKCGYFNVFKKLEIMHHTVADIPERVKPAFDFEKESKPRPVLEVSCIRETKWTEHNLQKLHEELRSIRRRRYIPPKSCNLKKKVVPPEAEAEAPAVEGIPDEEEDMFQACLFLQKTIKGRAIQAVMFEGRVKCQELIEELKSTHALQSDREEEKGATRKRIFGLQRQAEIERMQEKRKNEILSALEGKTTGDMLDYLAKELLRLQDERKTHAMAILAEQERNKREAAEAGRRQVEEQRRREHDEMFKQVMKMHQNIVQAFLGDVMIKNRDWLAHRQARKYVTDMAKKIDQAANETTMITSIFAYPNELKEEEIVADLIHNFALPEAEKRIVRKKMNDKQRNYLKICHDEVYSNIENIVLGARDDSGELMSLPMVGKHRVPPFTRVKYLRLKRMHESSSSSMSSEGMQGSENSTFNEKFIEALPVKASETKPKQQSTDKEIWSSGFSRQEVILEKEEPQPDDET